MIASPCRSISCTSTSCKSARRSATAGWPYFLLPLSIRATTRPVSLRKHLSKARVPRALIFFSQAKLVKHIHAVRREAEYPSDSFGVRMRLVDRGRDARLLEKERQRRPRGTAANNQGMH